MAGDQRFKEILDKCVGIGIRIAWTLEISTMHCWRSRWKSNSERRGWNYPTPFRPLQLQTLLPWEHWCCGLSRIRRRRYWTWICILQLFQHCSRQPTVFQASIIHQKQKQRYDKMAYEIERHPKPVRMCQITAKSREKWTHTVLVVGEKFSPINETPVVSCCQWRVGVMTVETSVIRTNTLEVHLLYDVRHYNICPFSSGWRSPPVFVIHITSFHHILPVWFPVNR